MNTAARGPGDSRDGERSFYSKHVRVAGSPDNVCSSA